MEQLNLTATDKATRYEQLIPQIEAVIAGEEDRIANMGNICAMLKEAFDWLWVGFYRVDTKCNELVLGPFQGPLACTRIPFGKGVCGEVWQSGQTQMVDDVLSHPNHIACSPLSRSEIVLPLIDSHQQVIGVLDIDAKHVACFDYIDEINLAKITSLLTKT